MSGHRLRLVLVKLLLPAVLVGCSKSEKRFCYDCTSLKDPECVDPFNGTEQTRLYVECSKNHDVINKRLRILQMHGSFCPMEFQCGKLKMHLENYDREGAITVRFCSGLATTEFDVCKMLYEHYSNSIIKLCELCDSDGCNQGSRPSSSGFPLAASCFLVFLAFR